MADTCRGERGFSLVEILMVVAILGLAMGAVFSLYRTHRNTAYSQVEVVDVQQNLRTALDTITRDLRNAGILVPAGGNQVFASAGAIPPFPNFSTNLRINVASVEGRFARVAFNNSTSQTGYAINSTPATVTLTVEKPATVNTPPYPPNVVDGFAIGDNVRLIRPVDGSQNLAGGVDFVITDKNRNAPSITIKRVDYPTTFVNGDVIVNGDMIARVPDAVTYPVTIDYYLVNGDGTTLYNGIACPRTQKCLVRRVNDATTELIAGNMSSLRFGYMDDNMGITEVANPTSPSTIRAVRVTVQGATATSVQLSGGPRSRSLTSVVKLRNRR